MNNNINLSEELNKLYKEHLEFNNKRTKRIRRERNDDFEENMEIIGAKENNEEEIVLRNIYFLMSIFIFINNFSINIFN